MYNKNYVLWYKYSGLKTFESEWEIWGRYITHEKMNEALNELLNGAQVFDSSSPGNQVIIEIYQQHPGTPAPKESSFEDFVEDPRFSNISFASNEDEDFDDFGVGVN